MDYDKRCGKSLSQHQMLYYIFQSILASEYKGLIAITQAHSIKGILTKANLSKLK